LIKKGNREYQKGPLLEQPFFLFKIHKGLDFNVFKEKKASKAAFKPPRRFYSGPLDLNPASRTKDN
jgi:hypothetical protein